MPTNDNNLSGPVIRNALMDGSIYVPETGYVVRFVIDPGLVELADWNDVFAVFEDEPEVGQQVVIGEFIAIVADIETELVVVMEGLERQEVKRLRLVP